MFGGVTGPSDVREDIAVLGRSELSYATTYRDSSHFRSGGRSQSGLF
jgi:hypothetical protein